MEHWIHLSSIELFSFIHKILTFRKDYLQRNFLENLSKKYLTFWVIYQITGWNIPQTSINSKTFKISGADINYVVSSLLTPVRSNVHPENSFTRNQISQSSHSPKLTLADLLKSRYSYFQHGRIFCLFAIKIDSAPHISFVHIFCVQNHNLPILLIFFSYLKLENFSFPTWRYLG